MSISAIGATTPSQAIQASAASAVTADATAAFSSTAATNASGLGNFFQQFASDLQSLLTQTQAATTGSATTGAATTGTTAGTTTTTTGTTPANASTQAATEQPGAAHHHHHHGGGGGSLQSAANQFVGQVAQAFGGGSGNAAPAPGATTNGANTLATDIVQALQNYGAFANNPATSTVSTLA